jgi:hypothetical protein
MIQDKHLQNLQEIADDTARAPRERDLARILDAAGKMLAEGEFKEAQGLLKVYLVGYEILVAC